MHQRVAAGQSAQLAEKDRVSEQNQTARRLLAEEIRYTQLAVQSSSQLFYDYLVGGHNDERVSELERQVLLDINGLLDNPAQVLGRVPQLPQSVSKLMNLLDSDDFDLKQFCSIVEKDPVIAAQLISVANSAQYNPVGDVFTDIKRSFDLLGVQGVKQYVLLAFMKNASTISHVYYRALGEKIWVHSEETARISRDLARSRGLEADTAFLIGLVHDMGKIIVFKLIVDAFLRSNPDDRHGSSVVKHLLSQKSMQLSVLVAGHWKMPEVLITAIRDLALSDRKSASSPLGQVLIDANFISEWKRVLSAGLSSEQEFEQAVFRMPFANDIRHFIEQGSI